jgi:ribosomal-protein-alanine N-acetyltransferase
MASSFESSKFFANFPVLNCGVVTLRQLLLSDSESYFNLLAAPEVNQYLSDEDIPQNILQAADEIRFWAGLFEKKQSIFWAITTSREDKLIGTIGFNSFNIPNRRAEISYELSHHYWRRGIMSNVLEKVLRFAFSEMNLNRIEAKTMLDNIPSQKLLDKVGFLKEGTAREYRIIRGAPVDVALYSLLAKDFYCIT